jgi:hypothetical protein
VSERKDRGGLRTELDGLRKNISATDNSMADMAAAFWSDGGVCCPSCGCPGYSELVSKQERREARVRQILTKLERDAIASGRKP